MNKESRNWFRLSKLIMDVGADVLQRLLRENIQTSFLNDLVYDWMAKVDKVKDNYAKIQWKSFKQDLDDMDETCKIHIRPLHNSWKFRGKQNLTLLEQVNILQKWANDIETSMKPFLKKHVTDKPENQKPKQEYHLETPISTKLLVWLEQIEVSIKNANFIPDNINILTTKFLDICQQAHKDLLREFKNHYDDFLSSCRFKVFKWNTASKEDLKDHIINLESDRKKKLESWKKVSESYFKSLRQTIKDLVMSLERGALHITKTAQLKKLCSDLKTVADEIDETELQKSCDTWHQELHTLFNKWSVLTESVQSSDICKSFDFSKDLESFHSIGTKQVKDFFVSKIENKELQKLKERKQLSEMHYLKLCHFRTCEDLQEFGSTLLVIVLRLFLLYPPMYGWSEEPPEFDRSVSAEIVRLKSFRNIIIEHCEKASIAKKEFDSLWSRVKEVLCRLAYVSGNEYEKEICSQVDYNKTCSFTLKRDSEFHRILDFCRDDILAEFKGLALTHQCLRILESVQKAERERSSRKAAETDKSDDHTDEETLLPTSIPEGIVSGYEAGKELGGPVGGAFLAIGGAAWGLLGGMTRTLLKK